MPAPNRWFLYKRCGDIIEGTRLISFKVPLKETISNGIDEHERFTPTLLVRMIEEMGKKLGMVIDLTFTPKYYQPEELKQFGVEYCKLKTEGHRVPSEDVYRKFSEVISSYLKRNQDNDHLIGVHCTHGVNRTGYLVCRYMIENMSFCAEDAISVFNKARGHAIERQNYIDDLKTRPRRDSNTSINEQYNRSSSSKPEGAKHHFKEKKRYQDKNKFQSSNGAHHHRQQPRYEQYSSHNDPSNFQHGMNNYHPQNPMQYDFNREPNYRSDYFWSRPGPSTSWQHHRDFNQHSYNNSLNFYSSHPVQQINSYSNLKGNHIDHHHKNAVKRVSPQNNFYTNKSRKRLRNDKILEYW